MHPPARSSAASKHAQGGAGGRPPGRTKDQVGRRAGGAGVSKKRRALRHGRAKPGGSACQPAAGITGAHVEAEAHLLCLVYLPVQDAPRARLERPVALDHVELRREPGSVRLPGQDRAGGRVRDRAHLGVRHVLRHPVERGAGELLRALHHLGEVRQGDDLALRDAVHVDERREQPLDAVLAELRPEVEQAELRGRVCRERAARRGAHAQAAAAAAGGGGGGG
eukprot:SAG22_NODE_3079_length_1957_cov_2.247578_1_plen_222_part_10